MPDYEKLYFRLAARVADAIDLLIAAQRECEDLYVSGTHNIDGGEVPAVATRLAERLSTLLESENYDEKADNE